eukprot:11324479-Ditylum_brightwellii.AAC.1
MDLYHLHDKVHNGFVYMEIRKGMYGLPQAGKIANVLLRKRLKPHGYFETSTPDLWKHKSCPVTFTLVVDDLGVKYIGPPHLHHLINISKKYYAVEIDYQGSKYCGIDLEWGYNNRTLDASMSKYVPQTLHKYQHPQPKRPKHSPFPAPPKYYGKAAQIEDPDPISPLLPIAKQKNIQQIVGSFLFYS